MVGLAQHPDQLSMKRPVLYVIGCVVAPHASWKPTRSGRRRDPAVAHIGRIPVGARLPRLDSRLPVRRGLPVR